MNKSEIKIDWSSDSGEKNTIELVDIIKDLKKILESINGVIKVRVLQNTENKRKFKFEVIINNINRGNRLGSMPVGIAIFVNSLQKNIEPSHHDLWEEMTIKD